MTTAPEPDDTGDPRPWARPRGAGRVGGAGWGRPSPSRPATSQRAGNSPPGEGRETARSGGAATTAPRPRAAPGRLPRPELSRGKGVLYRGERRPAPSPTAPAPPDPAGIRVSGRSVRKGSGGETR